MHKKFEINQTKIKGGCQSGRKVVPHDSKSDLPLGAALFVSVQSPILSDLRSFSTRAVHSARRARAPTR